MDLNSMLCIKTERKLRNDWTVAYKRKLYQIEERMRTFNQVMIHEHLNGSMKITYRGWPVRFKEIPSRPIQQKEEAVKPRKRPPIPSANHPWRKSLAFGFHRFEKGDLAFRADPSAERVLQRPGEI